MNIYISILLFGLSVAILFCSGLTWANLPDGKKSIDILAIGLLMFIIIWIFLIGNRVFNQETWQQNYMASMHAFSVSASLIAAYKEVALGRYSAAAGSITGTLINFFSVYVLTSGGFFA